MIVFLLLVIIAILLFGSSAVLGFIGAALGFIALVLALTFGLAGLAASLGTTVDNIFLPTIGIIVGLAIGAYVVLWLLTQWQEDRLQDAEPVTNPKSEAKRIWDFFALDIEHRFDVTDQVLAHDIYRTGDAQKLRRHCESVLRRLNGFAPSGHGAPTEPA